MQIQNAPTHAELKFCIVVPLCFAKDVGFAVGFCLAGKLVHDSLDFQTEQTDGADNYIHVLPVIAKFYSV